MNKFRKSLYNIKEMIKFSKQGLGRAILYAILLCTFFGLGKGIIYSVKVNSYLNVVIDNLQDDKYKFGINQGELDLETSFIKEEINGNLVYIDDSIKVDEYDKLKSIFVQADQYVLILKDGIMVNSNLTNSLPPIKMSYRDLGIENIDNDFAIKNIKNKKILVFPIICIYIIIFSLVTYLLDAFIIALLALLNIFILRLDISFSKVFSLVIYAATLPSILVLLLTIISPSTDFSKVSALGTIVYTFIILNYIRKDKENLK